MYEKKYNEAQKWIESIYTELSHERQMEAEVFFPELKESEDERIRKWCISHFKECINVIKDNDEYKEYLSNKVIAWLEKQGGEQNLTLPKWKYKKDHTPLMKDSIILNKYGCVAKSPSGALVSNVWVIDYAELAKLPKEEIEKQSEQKPTDKTAPKFNQGDWVIDNQGIVHQIANVVEIVATNNYGYNIVGGGCFNDDAKGARLWTIDDAKDGDVLYINNTLSESIMIYKSFNNGIINKYASYNKFGFEGENYLTLNDGYIIPATKEQRDLLFQKMKEAGYEWDAEKKELKKIEKKSVEENNGNIGKTSSNWSEEDEYIAEKLLGWLDTLVNYIHHDAIVSLDLRRERIQQVEQVKTWLKSLKEKLTKTKGGEI